MKTAVYARVSTEEQATEGYSIRAQIDKLKSYIQIKDWEFYKVYSEACDIIEPTRKTKQYQWFQGLVIF